MTEKAAYTFYSRISSKIRGISALIIVLIFAFNDSTNYAQENESEDEQKVQDTAAIRRFPSVNATLQDINETGLEIETGFDLVEDAMDLAHTYFSDSAFTVRLNKVQYDPHGYTHIRLKQYYHNLPVEGGELIVHINKDGKIYDISGKVDNYVRVDTEAKVSPGRAMEIALHDKLTKSDRFSAPDNTPVDTPALSASQGARPLPDYPDHSY
jgi:Zn-dependent metalloprotease